MDVCLLVLMETQFSFRLLVIATMTYTVAPRLTAATSAVILLLVFLPVQSCYSSIRIVAFWTMATVLSDSRCVQYWWSRRLKPVSVFTFKVSSLTSLRAAPFNVGSRFKRDRTQEFNNLYRRNVLRLHKSLK